MLEDNVTDNLLVPAVTVVGYSVCLEGDQRSKEGNGNLPCGWINL